MANTKNVDTNLFVKKAIEKATGFFEIEGTKKPEFVFMNAREEMNSFCEKETQEWVVANSRKGKIGIFTPESFEKESSHKFTQEKYQKLITHEVCHFYQELLTNTYRPVWLGEGLAIYLSEQYKDKNEPKKFEHFLTYHNAGGKDVYEEPGFVVKKLIEKFGKEKLLEYIKSLSKEDSEEFAKQSFKNIYGVDLSYKTINNL